MNHLTQLLQLVKARSPSSMMSKHLETFLGKINKFGQTPLLLACCYKSSAVIESLVEAGVRTVGANLEATDNDGNTTLIQVGSSSQKDEVPIQKNILRPFSNYDFILMFIIWPTIFFKFYLFSFVSRRF